MTKEEKQKICDSIFKYIISEELFECLDDDVFDIKSKEGLGEFYYNYIFRNIENANTELLNGVISTISPMKIELKTQKDYCCALCEILGIKKLPSTMITNVEKEYEKIFVRYYNLILHKYQSEITKIQSKLAEVRAESDIVKNAPVKYSFIRDISNDEKKLYELCLECNSLRTKKEMLEFSIKYLDSKMGKFCDRNDVVSVEKAKRQQALNLSRRVVDKVDLCFSPYKTYLEIIEDDLDRPYALFFKVKIYVIIEKAREKCEYMLYTEKEETILEKCKDYLSLIPKIDDLYEYKNSNPELYNKVLDKLIVDYKLIEELENKLELSVCLRDRKNILIKAIELYKNGDFEIFNNIIPIQIEGMFSDYLVDTTTFLRFSKMDIYINAVLKDKIRYLQEVNSDIYPEAVEYFMYYFNNMIRNKIAHGRYIGNQQEKIQDEIFAKELILDIGMLVHMLSRNSETEKMYRFIHGYQKYYNRMTYSEEHSCFGALFNDMIGSKLTASYDTIEKYRPIQVAYWLVNPYYEKIYSQVGDKEELIELRDVFLGKEFWQYVLKRLNDVISKGYNYINVNIEFMSVVKGLFKCNISSEVKIILGKVNYALYKIQKMKI